MLSIQECKKELNKKEERYTDEEIKQIKEMLYRLATIQYESNKLKLAQYEARGNSNRIHTGINR
jgi:hypothetical protein